MPLLSVDGLSTHYPVAGGTLKAVDGVSFAVEAGETVGLVGESGCGKSTLGKAILRLAPATSGDIRFDGTSISSVEGAALKPFRQRLQMVFQDPFGSLNPRQTVGEILIGPLNVHGIGSRRTRTERVADILRSVGLPEDARFRYPHEFSGGQRQRIGIARALILQPELVVCDEAVSALDVSVQAQILNILSDLKQRLNLSYVFISHDLAVVRYFCDRILVMYLGRIVESASSEALWDAPRHPYTRGLIAAVPNRARPRPESVLPGEIPSPRNLPPGCRFSTRCARATEICRTVDPQLARVGAGHDVACHHHDHTDP
ncbi:ABC transporter ATP-binding protein [Amorphus sp. 3PC139-8]|uniref:ABC transporter ATP-binding protein n=1 Tax=Amorphus sp. 3PC139-8 TaxID=2735676 RepID=UPI00345D1B90